MKVQQAFDMVFAYFVTDKHEPLYGLYVDPVPRTRCAVGCLLADDTLAALLALHGSRLRVRVLDSVIRVILDADLCARGRSVVAVGLMRRDLPGVSPSFLQALQILNDRFARGAEEERAAEQADWLELFHWRMERGLRELAEHWELVVPSSDSRFLMPPADAVFYESAR